MWDIATPLAFLLLPLPLVVARLWRKREEPGGALRVPAGLLDGLGAGQMSAGAVSGRQQILAWLVWIALVVALAGPRMVVAAPVVPASDREIVLALDLSGSMERDDMLLEGRAVRRIDALKHVAGEFIRGRAGDRVGLVIFAEEAYLAAPPSYDVEAVSNILDSVDLGMVGRSTAIGDGLGLALKSLQNSEASARVVVLLSDGSNNAGNVGPVETAGLATTLGIRVHTIALGPGEDARTTQTSSVDVETLAEIAAASRGTAFRVASTEDLEQVAAAIDDMETDAGNGMWVEIRRDLWPYPAALALAAALAMMAPGRRR